MGKIKEFFKRLFSRRKLLTATGETDDKGFEKSNIREELKVNINFKLQKMQKEYENGMLNENNISNKNLKELIRLYEEQIKELNYKIISTNKVGSNKY